MEAIIDDGRTAAPVGLPCILNLEDESLIRAKMQVDLEAAGFEVVPALSIDQAWAAFAGRTRPFSLLILNVTIRDDHRDGIGLCRDLRGSGYMGPILIQSGHSHRVREAFAAGASDYLLKPFLSAELVERVRLLLAAEEILATKGARAVAQQALAAAKSSLSDIRPRNDDGTVQVQMGHNGPPSEVPIDPPAAAALDELLDEIRQLLAQQALDPKGSTDALERLAQAANQVGSWLAHKADVAVEEAAKMLGKAGAIALITAVVTFRKELLQLLIALGALLK